MIRAFQWDVGRQIERLEWLLAQLPRYADWGYNQLYLHLEDAVEFPSVPGVARPDAYRRGQMTRLVRAAAHVGIKVVPIVNLLGHTQYLIKVPELRDLNELRAPDGSPLEHGQVCPLHPRFPEVAAKLLRDAAPFCTAGKVHVGLDESFHLGRCPRCRADIGRRGRAAHFGHHVRGIHAQAGQLGLQMGMWADMLYFLPGAISLLPPDVAVYEWYYYKFGRSPRVELFNFAETDTGERLRARSIEYWGCPMNGAFRHEPMPHFGDRLDNIVAWWRRCQRVKAEGFLVTSWEPSRLANELTTVIDAAAASLWLEPGSQEPRAMLERGFTRVFGKNSAARQAVQVALACDRFPFAGYPRWEINTRWDVLPRREPHTRYRREEEYFRRLAQRARQERLPASLQASVEFRHYLATRDLIVRRAARRGSDGNGVIATLPHVAGLRAARTMWRRTRAAGTRGPNELMVLADAARLKRPDIFGGPWQLCYQVANFAPAAQLVAVEQRRPDGTWETLQACHTIEFQARAARSGGGLTRTHAAPIRWNGDPAEFPHLRLVLRGLGQVRISGVELIEGTAVIRLPLRRKVLGRPAPRRGFPRLDWSKNQDEIPVTFASLSPPRPRKCPRHFR